MSSIYDRDAVKSFLTDLVLNSYGRKVSALMPVSLNFNELAQAIKVNANAFYGKLVVNEKYFLPKLPGVFDPVHLSPYTELFSSLFGIGKMYLTGGYGFSSMANSQNGFSYLPGLLVFDEIFFDDIFYIDVNKSTALNTVADITGQTSVTLNEKSISVFVNNSAVSDPSLFLSPKTINSLFNFGPQFFYFTGYRVVLS